MISEYSIIMNDIIINANNLTESQQDGYIHVMAGMLLIMWAARRFGRKNKK